MTASNKFRFGPTRGELWFWLGVSAAGLCLMGFAFWLRGLPQGIAIAEVAGIASIVFGYLGGRSVKRLIRREHP